MEAEESSFQSYDVAMPQDAARQNEAAPPAVELRHAQDKIAVLEDKIVDMRVQLEVAQRRELWLQSQIDRIQQCLLLPPRQGLLSGLLRRLRG